MSKVSNTYHKELHFQGRVIQHTRRRRICRHCDMSYFSVETIEEDPAPLAPAQPTDNPYIPLPPTPSTDPIEDGPAAHPDNPFLPKVATSSNSDHKV